MSIVLINQYADSDDNETNGEALQLEFKKAGVTAIIIPPGLTLEILPSVDDVAVITVNSDIKNIRTVAHTLKTELQTHNIKAVILPYNTSVEVLSI